MAGPLSFGLSKSPLFTFTFTKDGIMHTHYEADENDSKNEGTEKYMVNDAPYRHFDPWSTASR